MSNYDRRLHKLEARQPGAALTPKLVITFVCPKRGITGALWLDGSAIDRDQDETEAAFEQRVSGRSAIVFANPHYGYSKSAQLEPELRLEGQVERPA
jgi:hypothetical protein